MVDHDEDMGNVEDTRIPGQFDPAPTRVNSTSLQNKEVQDQPITPDSASPQGLSIGHSSVDQLVAHPFRFKPTVTATSTVDHPALNDQSGRPRVLGRRRHADLNKLPVPPAQDGSVSDHQNSRSQPQSQSRLVDDHSNATSLVKLTRSQSSKRQLSVSDVQSKDETLAPKDKVRVVSPTSMICTEYVTGLENMHSRLEDNLARVVRDQAAANEQLLAEKKILEQKVARLLEEKEEEFMQMKEMARREREAAVSEAVKLREVECLEKMHAHVASAREEADQAIARERAEVGLERQRLQDQSDARVSEAYKEAELKYNESMSRAMNEIELARQKAEDEKDQEIAKLRQDYYKLVTSTMIEPGMEALEAQASVPQGTPGSQTQIGMTTIWDKPAMDVDSPALQNFVQDSMVLRYVQRRDGGKPKPLNVWLNRLPQMKDNSIRPPMEVPVPRAGNPELNERAYMPDNIIPNSGPVPTSTFPVAGHGDESLIGPSATSDSEVNSGSLNLPPPPEHEHSNLRSTHPSTPTPALMTVSPTSSDSREPSLSSQNNQHSSPPPSGGNASDAPPHWAESLIGSVQELRALVEGLDQRGVAQGPRPRQTRGEAGIFRVKHDPRYRDTDRTEMMNMVRKKMQALFGIKTDSDIAAAVMKGSLASDEDVAHWMADGSVSPSLHPITPYWNDLQSPWNDKLADLFVEELTANSSLDKAAAKDHFLGRLGTLKKQLATKVTLKTEEYNAKKQIEYANNRRRTRRQARFDTRIRIASELAKANGENQDPIWLAIYAMVDSLGVDGMSTDCSGNEQRFPASIIPKDWRSHEIIDILEHVDRNYNIYTGLGKLRSGSAPHARQRLPNTPVSTRRALAGLPINFYHPVWYDSLTDTEKRWLGAKPAVMLPKVVKEMVGVVL